MQPLTGGGTAIPSARWRPDPACLLPATNTAQVVPVQRAIGPADRSPQNVGNMPAKKAPWPPRNPTPEARI